MLNTASNGKSDKALLLEPIFEFLNSFVVVHIILWKNHHPIVNQKERKESETAMILFNRNMSWLFGLPIHFSLFSSFCSPRGNFDDLNIAPCGYLKIKALYILQHKGYGYHIWLDADKPQGAPTYKVKCPFNCFVFLGYVAI